MCGIVGYVGDRQAPDFCWKDCRSWNTADMILLV